MAEKKAKKKSGAARKRRKLPGKSIGLTPTELVGAAPAAIESLQRVIEEDGGKAISSYREPFGGQ